MRTIYTLMKPSTVVDNLGNFYPDICAFPIDKFKYTTSSYNYVMTQQYLERPDLLSYDFYQTSDYSDIVLWLSNHGHYNEINAGDLMDLPVRVDIENFYIRYI